MTDRLDFAFSDFKNLNSDIEPLFQNFKSKKIIITGADGFLGMWLVCLFEYLNRTREMDIQIWLVDKSCDQFGRISSKLETKYEFIQSKIESLSSIPSDIDFFIHAAGNPDARDYLEDPISCFSTNTCGAINLVKLLKDNESLKSFVLTSSGWLSKDSSHLASNAGLRRYVESKECAEKIFLAAADQIKLPLTIVRLFSYFGPFQKLSSPWVVNEFIRNALVSRGLKLYGSGESKRALMYGTDLAVSVLRALTIGQKSNVLEIGSSESLTIWELANKIAANFNISSMEIARSMIMNKGLIDDFIPSNEFEKIQLRNPTDMNIALDRTIKWYREFE